MKRCARYLVTISTLCGLAGCGGLGPGIIGQEMPRVRIFNAVDNKSSVTVTYNDASAHSLGTSQGASFATVAPKDLIIANTNATPTVASAGSNVFTGLSSLYRINSVYSLYCGGVPGKYAAIAVNDVLFAGTTVGSMDVLAVHVGANTAGVDVFIVPAKPGGVSGASLFNSLQFGHVSAASNATTSVDGNGYTTLAVSQDTSYEVIVTAHSSTTPIATTTAVLSPTIFYTVVIYDSGAGTTGVQILSDRH